ncbi:hypothetical protein D3C76_1182500 [compost metagenome]
MQIVQQNTPGHTIDHQVVDGQQQALLAVRPVHQHSTDQWPIAQVEAALRFTVQVSAIVHRHDLCLAQQVAVGDGAIFGVPLPALVAESQAQGIVLVQHGQQCLFE